MSVFIQNHLLKSLEQKLSEKTLNNSSRCHLPTKDKLLLTFGGWISSGRNYLAHFPSLELSTLQCWVYKLYREKSVRVCVWTTWKGFSPVWTSWWRLSLELSTKALPHSAQTCTRGPWVWRCFLMAELSLNIFVQPWRSEEAVSKVLCSKVQVFSANACLKGAQHFLQFLWHIFKLWKTVG